MAAKLVAIGDSLTQGFQSGSIFQTQYSYPALIADCLGETGFRRPDFTGAGGLPFNIEQVVRQLADQFGERIDFWEFFGTLNVAFSYLHQLEEYWERGAGNAPSQTGPLHHNLAVWGFEIGDSYTLSEQVCRQHIPKPTDGRLLQQIPEFAMYRTARRTLNPSFSSVYEALTQLEVARRIGDEEGIENLIFWLGSNHCLGTVVSLNIQWSEAADLEDLAHVRSERGVNLWRPEHFQTAFRRAAAGIEAVNAEHVFIGNVPHVTIPPVSRGVTPGVSGQARQNQQGYFEYYTHFWIWDDTFRPDRHPHLERSQIQLIDQTIDEYNRIIQQEAEQRGWQVVDICGLLDRLAFRRQQGATRYQFPPELVTALKDNPATRDRVLDGYPLLDTRYPHLNPDSNDPQRKYQGGLFSLDGVHPGAIGYGLVAHEFLQTMQKVWSASGKTVDLQPLNWRQIVASDRLVVEPPINLTHLRETLECLANRTPLYKVLQLAAGRSM